MAQLLQRRCFVDALGQLVEGVEVIRDSRQLAGDLAGLIGIVPKPGSGRSVFEFWLTLAELNNTQIDLCLVQPLRERGDIAGEVLHHLFLAATATIAVVPTRVRQGGAVVLS